MSVNCLAPKLIWAEISSDRLVDESSCSCRGTEEKAFRTSIGDIAHCKYDVMRRLLGDIAHCKYDVMRRLLRARNEHVVLNSSLGKR